MKSISTMLVALLVFVAPYTPALAAYAASDEVVWFIGVDTSKSVPQAEFKAYADWLSKAVLAQLRPGDSVVAMQLDRDGAKTVNLDTRLSRYRDSVRKLNQTLHEMVQSNDSSGYTDIGSVLKHVRQRVALDMTTSHGAIDAARRYVAVIVTDGINDTSKPPPLGLPIAPEIDCRVVFLGVHSGTEVNLHNMIANAGLYQPEHVFVVTTDHVEGKLPAVPEFVGRRPDGNLLKLLERNITQVD